MGSISSPKADGIDSGLNIIIVGAGIAGLATATALTRNGKHHKITILESHPSLNEFGASIGILANGVRCLRSLGLEKEFAKVVTWNQYWITRNGITNKTLGHLPWNAGNWSVTAYGDEVWNINREDYQNVLADAAEAGGAKIIFDTQILRIDVDACVVHCENGATYSGDVIVGADGMKSIVRQQIPKLAHVEPVAWIHETAYRCTVPKSAMRGNPMLQELLDEYNECCWTVPGRYILTWPLPPNRPFDVVLAVTEPGDVPLGKWGWKVDPTEATKHFQDFCPQMQELLRHIDRAVKWTLGELPPLETCKSDNGRVVLAGDAFHAMIPHAASGGNSAIEDAVFLAECLDWAWKRHTNIGEDLHSLIARSTQVYEDHRKPRVERMQIASHEGYGFLGATGGQEQARDQMLAAAKEFYDTELAIPEEQRRKRPKQKADMNARHPTEPYLQWLFGYDAIATAKELLAHQQ